MGKIIVLAIAIGMTLLFTGSALSRDYWDPNFTPEQTREWNRQSSQRFVEECRELRERERIRETQRQIKQIEFERWMDEHVRKR
jgi:hypothetical protein